MVTEMETSWSSISALQMSATRMPLLIIGSTRWRTESMTGAVREGPVR
ncbi:hypothetical protein [Streptomyces sp. NRRL F-5053]|nr:hypothetical protein [Streptomyces sp. NRRL F-5053]